MRYLSKIRVWPTRRGLVPDRGKSTRLRVRVQISDREEIWAGERSRYAGRYYTRPVNTRCLSPGAGGRVESLFCHVLCVLVSSNVSTFIQFRKYGSLSTPSNRLIDSTRTNVSAPFPRALHMHLSVNSDICTIVKLLIVKTK